MDRIRLWAGEDFLKSRIDFVLGTSLFRCWNVKEAMERERDGQDSDFKRPYIKLEFTRAIKLLRKCHR